VIEPYSEHEADNFRGSGRIAIARSGEQVHSFIEKSITGEIRGKKLLFGKIMGTLAQQPIPKRLPV